MAGNDLNTKLLLHANAGNTVKTPYIHLSMDENAATANVESNGTETGTWFVNSGAVNTSVLSATGLLPSGTPLALQFDGSTHYLNGNNSRDNIEPDTTGTIAVWINPDTIGTTEQVIFGLSDSTSPVDDYFRLGTNASSKLFFQLVDTGSTRFDFASTATLSTGVWQHIAIVQDGVAIKVYHNGSELAGTFTTSTALGDWFGSMTASAINQLRIGCVNWNALGNVLFWDGLLDDFRYYQNSALSQTEITALYNAGAGTELNVGIVDSRGTGTAHEVQSFGDAQIQESVGGLQTVPDGVSFGGYALFDGTASRLTIPDHTDWDIPAGDWTIDGWVRNNSVSTQNIIGQYIDDNNFWALRIAGSDHNFSFTSSSTTHVALTGATIDDTNWHHVAVVKSGSDWGIYFDGAQQSYVSDSTTSSFAAILEIGARNSGADRFFDGAMDELRISTTNVFSATPVVGVTDTITVPTSPAVSGAATRILLVNDTDVTTDTGVNTHTVTNVSSNVSWQPGGKWNSASLTFDGTGDYISIPDSADWDIAGSAVDYTIDVQGNASSLPTTGYFINQFESTSKRWRFSAHPTSGFIFQVERSVTSSEDLNLSTIELLTTPGTDVWWHAATIKVGKYYGLYHNGVQKAFTWYPTEFTVAGPLYIGQQSTSSTSAFFGNLDEIRVQANNYFIAAPNSFPAAPLFLDMEGVDEDTTTTNDGYGGTVTFNGTAKLDNVATNLNPTTSLLLDGNSDYLTITDASGTDYDVVGSATDIWTIDAWIYPIDAATRTIINQFEAGSNDDGWELYLSTTMEFRARTGNVTILVLNGGAPTNSAWNHVAMVKSGSHYGLYIDGVQTAYTNDSSTDTFVASLEIGRQASASQYFNGNMEQVQITKANKFGVIPASFIADFDGADEDVAYTANLGQVGTFIGTGKLDNAQTKFGTTAFWKDGNSDAITFPDDADFDLSSGDWTIDCWVYRFDATLPFEICGQETTTNNFFQLRVQADDTIYFTIRDSGWKLRLQATGVTVPEAIWTHVSLVRTGTTYKIFVGGVEGTNVITGDITYALSNYTSAFSVGRDFDTGGAYVYSGEGWIDQFRITKSALWTAGFTPPTTALQITVPTTVLTQDTITVPTEEYAIPDVNVPAGAPQTLTLGLQVPVSAVQHSLPGEFPLSLMLETPLSSVGPDAPAVQALTLTLNAPTLMIDSNEDAGTTALTLTLLASTIRIDHSFNQGPTLMLTVSAGFAPGIGSLAPTIRKFINDPVVAGGCSQCGTLLWDIHRNAIPLASERVTGGLNFDTDGGLPDDRYVRCARCGWINNQNRNSSQRDGSRSGWGIDYPRFEVVPNEPADKWTGAGQPNYPGTIDNSTP